MPDDIFWGDPVRTSNTDEPGSVGVVINGVRIKNSTYDAGRRVADAGFKGLDTDAVIRTDVEILQRAGVTIETDHTGLRYRMTGALPKPSGYLVRVDRQAPQRTSTFGPGVGREKEPYREPHPWTVR